MKTKSSVLEKKHAVDFVKNYKEIDRCIAVNYNHGGTDMAMANKKMEKPIVNTIKAP